MARLIIGHVTSDSAIIWTRGDRKHPIAFIKVEPGNRSTTIALEERHGYTGAVEIDGLDPDTAYMCEVEFGAATNTSPHLRVDFGHCRGKFRTAPAVDAVAPFRFLLGSCNLHSLGFIASPDRAFEELLDRSVEKDARFMIHCGDQIYYDIPNFMKGPDIGEYRDKYLDAWGDSRPTRKFLTQLPQYMILDDHEITNDFSNDMNPPDRSSTAQLYKSISMKVYREFVHIRQPNSYGRQALYYEFSFGNVRFFVMDCRTERFGSRSIAPHIVGNQQMSDLKKWMRKYKDDLKFVVTSVPFVMDVVNDDDKWGAPAFIDQRNEVIDHIVQKQIGRLVFLTGDMHCSYHATMKINDDLEIHELMSSPINQLQKSDISQFKQGVVHTTPANHRYSARISKFFNDNSNAMLVDVQQGAVSYEIFRTKRSRIVRNGAFTP